MTEFTAYNMSGSKSDTVYPYCLFPSPHTPVYPLRRCTLRAPSLPLTIAAALREALRGTGAEVITDGCIKMAEGGVTYRLQIAVTGSGEGGAIALDIETDEPYHAASLTPRHYLEDNSDAMRDDLLRRHGWAVIRFSERQAALETATCCRFILAVLAEMGLTGISFATAGHTRPAHDRRPSRLGAERAAAEKAREVYLAGLSLTPEDMAPYADPAPLTEEEKEAGRIADKERYTPPTEKGEGYNAAHHFDRDNDIRFIPETHTYLYKGCDALKSVTTVISEYFHAFDAEAAAKRKAGPGGNPKDFIDRWRFVAKRASESGTHLHAQIENYLLGRPTNSSFHLRYKSPSFAYDSWADVTREFSYFLDFIGRAGLTPYRTEWPIYDTASRIAGAPDLIAQKDGRLMMFDWKRSTKVIDPEHSPGICAEPSLNSWGRTGIGTFSDLPDCSFIHYSLQQAVYKRILRSNYGLDICRTFLVVLHPAYTHFYIVETRDVEKYVDRIFDILH